MQHLVLFLYLHSSTRPGNLHSDIIEPVFVLNQQSYQPSDQHYMSQEFRARRLLPLFRAISEHTLCFHASVRHLQPKSFGTSQNHEQCHETLCIDVEKAHSCDGWRLVRGRGSQSPNPSQESVAGIRRLRVSCKALWKSDSRSSELTKTCADSLLNLRGDACRLFRRATEN